MHSFKRKVQSPLATVVLVPLIIFVPALAAGKVLFWGTPALQFIPWQAHGWQMILSGQFPLWNSFNGMGAPLLANYQSAFFYPPAWLAGLFYRLGGAGWMAWGDTLLFYLHMVWAGAGMILLVRRLELNGLAQGIAGPAYSLGAFLLARCGFFNEIWAAAWLPWILAGVSLFAIPGKNVPERSSSKKLIWLVLCIGMQLLSGHAQFAWYTAMLCGCWVVAGGLVGGSWKRLGKCILILGGCYLFAAALAAVQLLPTYEYLMQSQRAAAVDVSTGLTYSFWPWRLITYFAPGFFGNPGLGTAWGYGNYWEDAVYIGFLPVILALRAVIGNLKRKNQSEGHNQTLVWFLAAGFILSLVLALGKFTPVFPFLYRFVPTFDMFNAPTRFMLIGNVCLVLLAALGADQLGRVFGKARRSLKLFITIGIAVMLGAGGAWIFLKNIPVTILVSTFGMGVFWVISGVLLLIYPQDESAHAKAIWAGCVLGFMAFDLLIASWAVIPFTDRSLYNQDGTVTLPDLQDGRIYLPARDEYLIKFTRFFRFDDFSALEDWSALRTVQLPDINLLDSISSANNFDPLVPDRYRTWIDWVESQTDPARFYALMDVNLLETRDVTVPEGVRFTPVEGARRVHWTSCAVQAEDDQVLALLNEKIQAWVPRSDLFFPLVLSSPIASESATLCSNSGAEYLSGAVTDQGNSLSFQIFTSADGWVFLADLWYPNWIAKVDGMTVPIEKANYAFRAIYLPEGSHFVEFIYNPVSFTVGIGVSGVSVLVLAVLAFLIWKNKLNTI